VRYPGDKQATYNPKSQVKGIKLSRKYNPVSQK
jgi:hypothetical protein